METCDASKVNPKRKFAKAWLQDDRYKSWLREAPADNTSYFCIICNQNFSCTSRVSRHADSACHKNNLKGPDPKDNIKENRKFKQEWLDVPEFKSWLSEGSGRTAYCTICDRPIAGALSQLYRHAESKIHRDKSQKDTEANKSNNDLNTHNEPLLQFDERKKIAEIKYAALIAEKNIPHQTAKEILCLFQQIGEDPNVLKNMSMGRTKCTNIISNVLCPVETERVANNLQNTKFSIFVDETSDITNEKWMTFLVRYVDSETLDVRTQLVKLIHLDATDCSASKLFNAFQSEMYKLQIPFLNILSLSCDNANVMTGKHCSFQQKLNEKCKNLLTMPCPCHSAALVAHAACTKIPAFCEEFLRKIVNYINSSPKRSAIFNEFCECFQDTNHKLLKLCDTRWLSHYFCIDRILESWNSIKNFLIETVESDKTKSAEYLLSLVNKVDLKAYFLFLKYVLNFFNSFNAFFQAHETRIHLLNYKSVNLLGQISQNFLKPELLAHIYKDTAFSEQENQKPIKDVNLGSECEEYLNELIKEGHTDIIPSIRQNCLQFYVVAAEDIKKRLPVFDLFLYKFKIFQASVALFNGERETSFLDVLLVAEKLQCSCDVNGLKKEWLALYHNFTTEEKQNLSTLNFDNMWKEILKRQSHNIPTYPNLKSLVNAIRSLPHSNADPERIFSMLTNIKTKKRSRFSSTSLNAICVFKSALKTRGETILDMEINENHLSRMTSQILYASPANKIKKDTLYADIAGPSSYNDT